MRQALRATLLALPVLSSQGISACAETIPIRTGEHDGFSRLVLPLDQPAKGWTFGRLDDGYQLRLGRGGVTFDLTHVFDKIPRTRLAAISADDRAGRLTLRLACACHAEVFPFRETLLVIDIRPGPPPKNSPFETPLPLDGGDAPSSPTQVYDWRKVEAPELPKLPPPHIAMPELSDPAVARAREALLRQLARAGTQGLVDVDPRKLGLGPEKSPRNDPVSAENPKPEIGHTPDGGAGHPRPEGGNPAEKPPGKAEKIGILARTVMDRDAPEKPDPGLTAVGGACPADAGFDIATWGGTGDPTAEIASHRRALLGEFDQPDPKAVLGLVQTYLYYGFGAEARTVLQAFPKVGEDARPSLAAMGAILDDEKPQLANKLSGLSACAGKVALWSVLAPPQPGPGDPVDAGAVLRNFSGLPIHLRRELGPALAKVFLARGDRATTLALRAAIGRAAGDPGPAVGLMDARIDMANGHPVKAEAALQPVVKGDSPLSPEAMVLLVESRLARGEAVSGPMIEALGALAHENRATPMGARLRRAEALAMASAGRFAQAFTTMGDGTDKEDKAGRARLWKMLAELGGDEALVQNAIVRPAAGVPAQTRLMIADRLLALGFAAPAEAWVVAGATPQGAARLALARIALARRDGAAALRQLAGMDNPDASLLRARAHALLGDHETAVNIYAELGAPDLVGAEAWRAGDWAKVEKDGSTAQKKALSLPEMPSRGGPQTPLARDRALIEDSRKAREALNALLKETPSTATPPDATAHVPATH